MQYLVTIIITFSLFAARAQVTTDTCEVFYHLSLKDLSNRNPKSDLSLFAELLYEAKKPGVRRYEPAYPFNVAMPSTEFLKNEKIHEIVLHESWIREKNTMRKVVKGVMFFPSGTGSNPFCYVRLKESKRKKEKQHRSVAVLAVFPVSGSVGALNVNDLELLKSLKRLKHFHSGISIPGLPEEAIVISDPSLSTGENLASDEELRISESWNINPRKLTFFKLIRHYEIIPK